MLKELVGKELKNTLRDRKTLLTTILMPLLIFGVMGVIYGFAFGKAAQTVKQTVTGLKEHATLYVCDADRGEFSELLLNFTRKFGKEVVVSKECSVSTVKEELIKGNYTLGVYVPPEASDLLREMKPVNITVITKANRVSFSSSMAVETVLSAFVNSLNSYIRAVLVVSRGLNPQIVISPVIADEKVVFKGELLPPNVLTSVASSFMMFAFAPLIVVSMALGQAASSMAVENEEKTLEVLLSLPIPRSKIVTAKLVGTMVLVLFSTLSFAAGAGIYAYSLTTALSGLASGSSSEGFISLSAFGRIINPTAVGLMLLATFLSLTAVASLGLLLGSLSPDVRTSSTFIGQLSFLVMIPGLILVFIDLSSLGPSGQAFMVALSPFIAPVLILKAHLEGMEWVVPVTIGWSAIFTTALIFASAKLLNSERLLTLQHTFMRRGRERKGLFRRK
ncbi:MAG: ABC transporter permease [Desulfurococcales archaeon]|nr:ABC transporter permease [Desulfurococcales archaeon]